MGNQVLQERLGVSISEELLDVALTHRSYSYEHEDTPNNERLEFLGDSVLGFVVTTHLFARFPHLAEGELTKLKNGVVSTKALAAVGRELDLGSFLRLGRGEETTGGRDKDNLIADAVEAILAAIYLELGLDAASAVVAKLIFPMLDDHESLLSSADPKTSLQEVLQERGFDAPVYTVEHEGPDHDRTFHATVAFGNHRADGTARSRKAAEALAAAAALELLEVK